MKLYLERTANLNLVGSVKASTVAVVVVISIVIVIVLFTQLKVQIGVESQLLLWRLRMNLTMILNQKERKVKN